MYFRKSFFGILGLLVLVSSQVEARTCYQPGASKAPTCKSAPDGTPQCTCEGIPSEEVEPGDCWRFRDNSCDLVEAGTCHKKCTYSFTTAGEPGEFYGNVPCIPVNGQCVCDESQINLGPNDTLTILPSSDSCNPDLPAQEDLCLGRCIWINEAVPGSGVGPTETTGCLKTTIE